MRALGCPLLYGSRVECTARRASGPFSGATRASVPVSVRFFYDGHVICRACHLDWIARGLGQESPSLINVSGIKTNISNKLKFRGKEQCCQQRQRRGMKGTKGGPFLPSPFIPHFHSVFPLPPAEQLTTLPWNAVKN